MAESWNFSSINMLRCSNFFVFFTFQHCEVIGHVCRWCQHLTVGKLDRFKLIFRAMLLIWTDVSSVSSFSLMGMKCTNLLFFPLEKMSKSTRSYIWLVLAIDTVAKWITGFRIDLNLHARDTRESCYCCITLLLCHVWRHSCRSTVQCCVSVPWVPILWMERDWLHFVSHAVLEGSQIQTTNTLHLGDSSQAETLSCLNQWEFLFFLIYFLIVIGCCVGMQGACAPLKASESVYVNPILTSFA